MPQEIDRAESIVMLIQQQFLGRCKGMTLYFYNTVNKKRYYTAAISNLSNVHMRATEDEERPSIFFEIAMQIAEPRSKRVSRDSNMGWDEVSAQPAARVVYSKYQFFVPQVTEIGIYEYGFEARSPFTGVEAIKNEYFDRHSGVYGALEITRPQIRDGISFEPVKVWRLVDDGFDEFIKRSQYKARRLLSNKHPQVGQHHRQLILTSEEEE